MAKPKIDFSNPQTSSSGGGFAAGLRRVDTSKFVVYRPELSKRQLEEIEKLELSDDAKEQKIDELRGVPKLVKEWHLTRLTDDGDVMHAGEDDAPVTEIKRFGLGGKALQIIHPGKADGPDDDDPADMGDEEGAEGNTIFISGDSTFQIHNKAAFFKLRESLVKAGMKPEVADRFWAPDEEGMIVFMDQEADEEMQMPKRGPNAKPGETEALRYVVVKEIRQHGGKKAKGQAQAPAGKTAASAVKGAAGKSEGKEGASASGADSEVEKTARKTLRKIGEDNAGKTISVKALLTKVSAALTAGKLMSQVVPVTSLVKEDKWLAANAEALDFTYDADERMVKFAAADGGEGEGAGEGE